MIVERAPVFRMTGACSLSSRIVDPQIAVALISQADFAAAGGFMLPERGDALALRAMRQFSSSASPSAFRR